MQTPVAAGHMMARWCGGGQRRAASAKNGDRPRFPRFTESRSCWKRWPVPVFFASVR